MPITLGSNIASIGAQRRLGQAAESLAQTSERLSSGMRINRASDDAAGLAVSASLNASTRVFTQAIRNVGDGLSLLAVADGALAELSNIAVRQKELAEQAANGVYTKKQRLALHDEANKLVDEWNRIVGSTSFNGMKILDGSVSQIQIQAGYGESGSVAFDLGSTFLRSVGDGTFGAQTIIDVLGSDAAAFGGDFNEDGNMDIVVGSMPNGSIILGNGDGTFLAPTVFTTASALDIGVADFNNDGHLDVVYDAWSGNYLAIFQGNGDGTFKLAGSYATEDRGNGVAIADFNLDNKLDIANVHRTTGTVYIFLNQGDGTFNRASTFVTLGTSPYRISTGDFNNDGIPDLASKGLYYGQGDGTFVPAFMSPFSETSIAFADFNMDGRDDLALRGGTGYCVYLNDGSGTIPAPQTYAAYPGAGYSLVGVDLTGDGYADLLGGSFSAYNVANVLINKGDGTFHANTTYATSPGSHIFDAKDFNGDGAPDIISANYTTGDVGVIFQNSTQTGTMPHFALDTAAEARGAFAIIDAAFARVTATRGAIGAMQSRLQIALDNLYSSRENYAAAASRIMDADIAYESSALIRQKILQNTAIAILAQANQQPSLALQLLG